MSAMKDFLSEVMERDGVVSLPDDDAERDAYLARADSLLWLCQRVTRVLEDD